jgi:hypothetical protein
MGVHVKGMKLPDSCRACLFCAYDAENPIYPMWVCRATDCLIPEPVIQSGRKMKFCPLTEPTEEEEL